MYVFGPINIVCSVGYGMGFRITQRNVRGDYYGKLVKAGKNWKLKNGKLVRFGREKLVRRTWYWCVISVYVVTFS